MSPLPDATPDLTPLGHMHRGQSGIIHAIDDNVSIAHRLRDLGFAEDLTVEVLHQSTVGRDPIAVRVGDMTVALRRADANAVKVVSS